jgi:4-phosphopantoate--beta-alanine ligase
VEISKDHPRYRSLMARERLARLVEDGIVTPTGLISHGRGEAFDYLLGERTVPEAELAERTAAAWLLEAERPVLCVNGNAAALVGKEMVSLAAALSSKLEVNLFHRTEERMERVISHLEALGRVKVLGREPDARIEGIASDRALCTKEGIFDSDVILVPIEDGDRAEALVTMGTTVIAINPLSRTSVTSTVTIVDEAVRAVGNIERHVNELRSLPEERKRLINGFDNRRNLFELVERMCISLRERMRGERPKDDQ